MRIGVLTANSEYEISRMHPGGEEPLAHSLSRLKATAKAVTAVLEEDGHEVTTLPVDAGLRRRLAGRRLDLVFNTYFGPARRVDQAHIASLLELVGVPFSGGGAACHFLGLSKPVSRAIFRDAGIPGPGFFTAAAPRAAADALSRTGLAFPLIVKASGEGEGIGLDQESIVRSSRELENAVARLLSAFPGPALVEELLPGRELTVGVVEGEKPLVLPITEIAVPTGTVFDYKAKAADQIDVICPARLPSSEARQIERLAVAAGRAVGCRDYWRVDFRMNASGEPRILEVNTLPGLMPGYSDMTKMADTTDMKYPGLIRAILESARARDEARSR